MNHYFYYIFLFCSTVLAIQPPTGIKAESKLFNHAVKNYTLCYEKQNPTKVAELKKAASIIQDVDAQEDPESKEDKDGAVDIDEKTFDEMRFVDSTAGAPFLESLNPTTPLGLAYCIQILTSPTANPTLLRQRQKEIQYLIDHPEYHEKIEKELQALKNMEIPIQEDKAPDARTAISLVRRKILSPLFFTFLLYNSYNNMCQLSPYQIDSMIFFLLIVYARLWGAQSIPETTYCRNLTDECFTTAQKSKKLINVFKASPKYSAKFINGDYHVEIYNIMNTISRNWQTLKFPQAFFKGENWTSYNIVMVAPLYIFLTNVLKQQFDRTRTFYNDCSHGLNTLNQWHQGHQQYKKILSLDANLSKDVFSLSLLPEKDTTIIQKSLCELQETEPSNLLNPSAMYATYKRQSIVNTQEFQTTIKNKYRNIGYIDALCALARLKKQHGFAFAEYVDTKTPHVNIVDALHPNNLAKSIPNSFFYTKQDQQKAVIISGQNGSGKSFSTKQFYNNAYLAQTTTVPCSTHASEVSPFALFKIQANISDSDAQSKFQTEKSRLSTLVAQVAALEQKGLKSLVLCDETFSTTSAVLGEPLLASLIEMQSKTMQKSLIIYITHLHNILKLPNTKQMSIGLIKNPDGTNTSTFTLQDGPCFDNDASLSFARSLPVEFQQTFLNMYKQHAEKKNAPKTAQEKNNQEQSKEPTEAQEADASR